MQSWEKLPYRYEDGLRSSFVTIVKKVALKPERTYNKEISQIQLQYGKKKGVIETAEASMAGMWSTPYWLVSVTAAKAPSVYYM